MKAKLRKLMLVFCLLETCCSTLVTDNLAYKRPTFENGVKRKTIDKTVDGKNRSCVLLQASPDSKSFTPWWSVQLNGTYFIKTVTVFYNPIYSGDELHLENFAILTSVDSYDHLLKCGTVKHKASKRAVDYVNVTCLDNAYGNLVHIIKSRGQSHNIMSICEVYVYGEVNPDKISLSYKKPTEQNGVLFSDISHLAVDGNLETCTRVRSSSENAWWTVMLDDIYAISGVHLVLNPNNNDANVDNVGVYISNDVDILKQQLCDSIPENRKAKGGYLNLTCITYVAGKYVTVMKTGGRDAKSLLLCEVLVMESQATEDCINGGMKCSSSSVCISKENICDRVKQCNDGSDELHCECLSYQYKCVEGLCIHNDWLCDGTKDCPKGDDEELALCRCMSNQFKCFKHRLCVDKSKRCDGIIDCPDSSDEFQCLYLEKGNPKTPVFIRGIFQGVDNYYICSAFWTTTNSFQACEHMGRGFPSTTRRIPFKASNILVLKSYEIHNDEHKAVMTQFVKKNACRTGLFVKLSCFLDLTDEDCGRRGIFDYSESFPQYIINGDAAKKDAWPWHVQVIVGESNVCGGSILDYYWILTAAHCISDLNNISLVTVKFGTNLNNDPGVVGHAVSQFFIHPNYTNYFSLDDIALLKLEHPIMFNSFSKPVCLPKKYHNDTKLKSYRYCIITGFGSLERAYGSRRPQRLRQGRMDLMTNDECLRNLLNDTGENFEVIMATNKIVCAGSMPTTFGINSCMGDSGGPLVCKNENGVWTQIGIMMSYYEGRTEEHCSNSIFARVSHHLDFIRHVILT